MAFHYPRPERRDEQIRNMSQMGTSMAGLSGFIEGGPWLDPESDRLVAISVWESKEAFLAARLPIARRSDQIPPGETRPRELFFLERG